LINTEHRGHVGDNQKLPETHGFKMAEFV